MIRSTLPPYMAHAVMERYVYGRTAVEIAKELGISDKRIVRYCSVGIKRIKLLMDLDRTEATEDRQDIDKRLNRPENGESRAEVRRERKKRDILSPANVL
ncbi:hypothetical protein ACFL3Q_11155 [Planctomycetota bacterium]